MPINFDIINLKKIQDDNPIKRIIKNSGIIFLGDSTASALNIISFTIMAKQLGPELLGIFVLAQTYAHIFNDIFNIQTWETMVKFGSMKSKDEEIAEVIKTNIILDFIGAVVGFVLAVLLVRFFVNILGWDKSLIHIASLYSLYIIFNITTFTIGIPRLYDKFLSIAKIHITMAVLKFMGILYAMYYSKSLIFYVSVYLFIDIFQNLCFIVFCLIVLRSQISKNWWKTKLKLCRDQIRFIWWTNLRTIIRIPVRHFDMIVISSIMPLKMVGLYKVYKEIASLITRIGDPVDQSIFPEFTKLLGNKDIKKTASVTKKTIVMLSGVSTIIVLLLFMVSKFIVEKFFGVEYLSQISALYVLLLIEGVIF
ncbi:MAG: lipopolysaccharide biosynthesis protein, partial [bacterium]